MVTVSENPAFPLGGLASFTITDGVGTITIDSVDAGTGLREITAFHLTNATVNIPAFTPGTFAPVTVTFSVINRNQPLDFTLGVRNSFHGVIIRAQCPAAPPTVLPVDSAPPSEFPAGADFQFQNELINRRSTPLFPFFNQ